MTSQQYQAFLEDPLWQSKRLTILERDKYTCQSCHSSDRLLLDVHHILYLKEIAFPWDYPDYLLTSLCRGCHIKETQERPKVEEMLLRFLRTQCFTDTLTDLLEGLMHITYEPNPAKTLARLSRILSDGKARQRLINDGLGLQ